MSNSAITTPEHQPPSQKLYGVGADAAFEPVPERPSDWIRRISSSRFNYWAGYAVNLTLVAWFLWWGTLGASVGRSLSVTDWFVFASFGLVLWTFLEYQLHRFVYHVWESPLSKGHGHHHETPTALLGVPWYVTTIVVVSIFYLLADVFNPQSLGVVMGFTWLGYIGYCLVHHSIHHWNFQNPVFKFLKRHHMIHHYHPETNWGMVTDVWDRVFSTKNRLG